jgi:hypothetical protein
MSDAPLADRYELGDRLGFGGMSTVQIAYDRRLERDVAVKLLAEHLAHDEQFVSRFRREALAAARLVHPNIVQVFDFGLDDASGRQYIVMELIRGQSGAEILRERGYLPVDEALDLVGQSCRGLDYAHRNGVVHRDVKPGNLLRSAEGVVKLADFGIAKALSDDSAITQVGSVLGTAAYLAPEQAAGEEAGPRADLYALGVVTYQLIAGRLPYEAASLSELVLKQQREQPPALEDLVEDVTPQLSAAVDRALALDPRDRHPGAEAMREALLAGARGRGEDTTGATRVAGPATGATVVARRGGTAEFPPVVAPPAGTAAPVEVRVAREPRVARAAATAAVVAPGTRAPQRRRGAGRLIGAIAALVLVAAAIAAAVSLSSGGDDAVKLRDVTYDNVNRIVDEMNGLIDDNTR